MAYTTIVVEAIEQKLTQSQRADGISGMFMFVFRVELQKGQQTNQHFVILDHQQVNWCPVR